MNGDAFEIKKPTQARSWILTLPFEHYNQEYVETKLRSYSYVGQLEKGSGENGFLHWQIYIENKNAIKFSTLRNSFPKGHFEMRQGTRKQAYDYCLKTETSEGIQISNGEISLDDNSGDRNDLKVYTDMVLLDGKKPDMIILECPAAVRYVRELDRLYDAYTKQLDAHLKDLDVPRETFYLYGKTGVGKTRGVYNWLAYDADADKVRYSKIYRVTDYKHPFDEYDGEEIIVFDEFAGQVSFEELLMITDRYPVKLGARYKNKIGKHKIVVFISNAPLEHFYKDKQRSNSENWRALLRRIDQTGFNAEIVGFNADTREMVFSKVPLTWEQDDDFLNDFFDGVDVDIDSD